MEEQILIDLINKSMQASALQIRRSLGRMPYAATREQALSQVLMLQRAKEAQQVGKPICMDCIVKFRKKEQ